MRPFFFPEDPLATIATLRALADDLEQLTVFRPNKQLEGAPLLDDWSFAKRSVPCLQGRVLGHPLLGITHAMTSEVFAMDATAGWVRTYSRYYKLGQKLAAGAVR